VINWKPVWRNPTQESMVNNQKFIMAAMKKAASGSDQTDKVGMEASVISLQVNF